jgi:hypothetical protein
MLWDRSGSLQANGKEWLSPGKKRVDVYPASAGSDQDGD